MALQPVGLFPRQEAVTEKSGHLRMAWQLWFDRLLRRDRISVVAWTPAEVATVTVAEQTVTVTGAVAGEHVSVTPPGTTAGVGVAHARVSAANTVAVAFVNPTAGGLTPPSGDYIFRFGRP